MAADKEVTFTIAPDGEITIDMENFHGVGCSDLMKAFDSLGETSKQVLKPEHDECNRNTSRLTQKV